ncbi:MAG: hypothetical protein ACTSYX_10820 [Candidatus Thorarchaeota archaeon]
MSEANNSVLYLQAPREEAVAGGNICIMPGPHESALHMVTRNMQNLIRLASSDRMVRLFLTLQHEVRMQPNEEYPIVLDYPIVVGANNLGSEAPVPATETEAGKELEKQYRQAKEAARDAGVSILFATMRSLYKDTAFRNRLLKGRIPRGPDADKFFENLLRKHGPETGELLDEIRSLYMATEEVFMRYEPVLRAIRMHDKAVTNHDILQHATDLTRGPQPLIHTLARIRRVGGLRLRILSVCLECLTRYNQDPYIDIQLYPGNPEVVASCKKCGADNVFTTVSLEVPSSMALLFHEELISRMIVGNILSRSREFRRVYVCKTIRSKDSKQTPPFPEIDILAITRSGETIVFDITHDSRRAAAFDRANKMKFLLDDYPISKLVCVDLDPKLVEFSPYGKNILVMHARHLARLEEFVSHITGTKESANG